MLCFALDWSRRRRAMLVLAAIFCTGPILALAGTVGSQVDGNALIAADPLDPQAYIDFSAWLVKVGHLEKAAEILEIGQVKAHPSADLLVSLGVVYQDRDLVARAEKVTRAALVIDPEHVPAHLRLGEIYFKLGWPKSGLENIEQAVALAPDEVLPKAKLIGALLEARQNQAAEERCLEFLATFAESPDLWLALGQVFEQQIQHQKAFTTYGQVLTLDPTNAEAYSRRGRLFCQFGQFVAAEESCRKALELDPDNSLAHAYMGIACSHLGKSDQAKVHAERAEAAGFNMTVVWKQLNQ